jgi:hypothetical protein
MARRKNEPLKVVSSVRVNGEWVILDDLPPEKQAEIKAYLREQYAAGLQAALNAHPDDAKAALKAYGI